MLVSVGSYFSWSMFGAPLPNTLDMTLTQVFVSCLFGFLTFKLDKGGSFGDFTARIALLADCLFATMILSELSVVQIDDDCW